MNHETNHMQANPGILAATCSMHAHTSMKKTEIDIHFIKSWEHGIPQQKTDNRSITRTNWLGCAATGFSCGKNFGNWYREQKQRSNANASVCINSMNPLTATLMQSFFKRSKRRPISRRRILDSLMFINTSHTTQSGLNDEKVKFEWIFLRLKKSKMFSDTYQNHNSNFFAE